MANAAKEAAVARRTESAGGTPLLTLGQPNVGNRDPNREVAFRFRFQRAV